MLTQTLFVIFGQALNDTSEQSEVSILNAILRSLTYVRDDRPHWVNIYIIAQKYLLEKIILNCLLYLIAFT